MPRVIRASRFAKGDLVTIKSVSSTTYRFSRPGNKHIGSIVEVVNIKRTSPQYCIKAYNGHYYWFCGKDLEKLFTV